MKSFEKIYKIIVKGKFELSQDINLFVLPEYP